MKRTFSFERKPGKAAGDKLITDHKVGSLTIGEGLRLAKEATQPHATAYFQREASHAATALVDAVRTGQKTMLQAYAQAPFLGIEDLDRLGERLDGVRPQGSLSWAECRRREEAARRALAS